MSYTHNWTSDAWFGDQPYTPTLYHLFYVPVEQFKSQIDQQIPVLPLFENIAKSVDGNKISMKVINVF